MTARQDLVRVVHQALGALELEARVAAALPRFRRQVRQARGGVYAVAIGKAAPAMAAGLLAEWGDALAQLLVVTTDGTNTLGLAEPQGAGRVKVIHAGHPLPDARSARAGERCLAMARACAEREGFLVVLVSGGASALVCAPSPGVRLVDKRDATRAMLSSGATIRDVNVVRKHLSRIKGGGLARSASPATVVTLVASDVIGGDASDVGSGPSVGDASRASDARGLLRRYAPHLADLPLVRTGPAPNAARPVMVASPEELARVVRDELRARGLHVRLLPPSQRPVEELARQYIAIASALEPGCAIVRAAEPSVTVPSPVIKARGVSGASRGSGGRSTHLATLVGRSLPRGALFLAAATDGVDGTSGTSGAIVDATFRDAANLSSIDDAIDRFDTGALHLRAGSALSLRPTGHNLADLHVLTVAVDPLERVAGRASARGNGAELASQPRRRRGKGS